MSELRLEATAMTFRCRRGDVVEALKPCDLKIAAGDHLAIVGASGSGKSTLLLLLGGMLAPTSGKVVVDDQDLYAESAARRAAYRQEKVGFVFQSFHLLPYLSALENIQLPLWLKGWSNERQRARAEELLAKVGLADRGNHKPSELSVGQRQRVALARVLANDPEIVLADEPTGNLDPEQAELVSEFLAELPQQGRTLIVVTHDPTLAARAPRRLELRDGKLEDSSLN
ncbi:MAG: ABC transporter ATP-binding protein [Planctomycetota bacterium]